MQVEDLLEYYLRRATTTQAEAERLLAGSRDLEESIGVSLSARRFEVWQWLAAPASAAMAAATTLHSAAVPPPTPEAAARQQLQHNIALESHLSKRKRISLCLGPDRVIHLGCLTCGLAV